MIVTVSKSYLYFAYTSASSLSDIVSKHKLVDTYSEIRALLLIINWLYAKNDVQFDTTVRY